MCCGCDCGMCRMRKKPWRSGKLCRYFEKGYCRDGSRCRFSHREEAKDERTATGGSTHRDLKRSGAIITQQDGNMLGAAQILVSLWLEMVEHMFVTSSKTNFLVATMENGTSIDDLPVKHDNFHSFVNLWHCYT